ncbi:MAG: hypothetical protein AAF697_02265 [Pseudomonadota bacterium]
MRTPCALIAAGLVFLSSPALAGNGTGNDHSDDHHAEHSVEGFRIEARAGVAWSGSHDYPAIALAFGYDLEAADKVVAGAELALEKILTEGEFVEFEFSGRLGYLVSDAGQVFVLGGYTASEGERGPHAGFGYEHHVGHDGWYVSAEYHRLFGSSHNVNFALAGVGIKF